MDFAEFVGFLTVVGIGLLMCLAPIVEIPYENIALIVCGSVTLAFCAWGLAGDLSRKYKIVRK